MEVPRSSKTEIELFEVSTPWKDAQSLLRARLYLNYRDLLNPEASLEALRLLQGSSAEMNTMLKLPSMLKEAVEKHQKEEKWKNERIRKQDGRAS
jgi:hypothetical protein